MTTSRPTTTPPATSPPVPSPPPHSRWAVAWPPASPQGIHAVPHWALAERHPVHRGLPAGGLLAAGAGLPLLHRRGAPVSLTGSLARTSATQYGFVDQWKTSRGTAVQVASSCGVDRLGLVKGRSVGFLPRQGEGSAPMGVVGDAAHYFNGSVCDGPSWSISRLDLRTNKQQLLAGRGVNKGSIGRDADLVDSSR